MNIEWQIPFTKEDLRKNKGWVGGGALFAGLIILGTVAGQCKDLDPSGQARNNDIADVDKTPENDKGVKEITLTEGRTVYL